MLELNLAGIVPESVVDGPGIRLVLFAQGCPHDCPGCFNADLQPFRTARTVAVSEVAAELEKNPHIQGVTFSGGEPFAQVAPFSALAKICRQRGLSIWCYTGYTFDQLAADREKTHLLTELDVLVDGRFVQELKDPTLRFRGSSNQRLIDVRRSLAAGRPITWDDSLS